VNDDPFGALGLPARAGLSDEDVRAAWRRIAAATHPDRDDGGDPVRFSAAAAAYETLRTSFGRGEALADLGPAGPAHRPAHRAARHARRSGARGLNAGGRGGRLMLRTAAAAAVTAVAFLAVGWTPATAGLLAGALTWLAVASRSDLRGHGDRPAVIRGTDRWRRDGWGR
jgi:curved DNA-binding protein CbpA